MSLYVRAQQTLSTLCDIFSLPEDCLLSLTLGGDAAFVNDYLLALASEGIESVLIVSHLPLVGYLVAELSPQTGAPMFATFGRCPALLWICSRGWCVRLANQLITHSWRLNPDLSLRRRKCQATMRKPGVLRDSSVPVLSIVRRIQFQQHQ